MKPSLPIAILATTLVLPAVRNADAAPAGARVTNVEQTTTHPAELRLEQARRQYQALVDQGGWPTLEGSGTLRQGAVDPEIVVLRERLRITGDLRPDAYGGHRVFTPALTEAVVRFQRRHGLRDDGIVGPKTRAALNVPASERLAQIEANLERWDALETELSGRYVLVNIPEFTLRAYDGGEEALQMKVVVGEEFDGRATPTFSDEMEHVVFRPYWMIPASIASEEIVPAALENRDWFAAQGYQIVRDYDPASEPLPTTSENLHRVRAGHLRLRQDGGEQNALGLVKFMFPNHHAVYLHDTPADHLFDRADRLASHGCVRVEDPVALADFVLDHAPGSWPPARIRQAMHQGETHQRVELEEPLPVHIMYWTVWADDTDGVRFMDDVYGKMQDTST